MRRFFNWITRPNQSASDEIISLAIIAVFCIAILGGFSA